MQLDPSASQTMLSALRTPRRSPWLPLLSALLELAGGKAELIRHTERAWASATFSGSRHTVVLAFAGPDGVDAGERVIDLLPEHEFAISRLLVADAAVVAVEHTALPTPRLQIEVELLVLDEG